MLLDAADSQCASDGDCAFLGAGYVCEADVCVGESGEGPGSSSTTQSPDPTTGESTTSSTSTSTSTSSATQGSTATTDAESSTGGEPPGPCADVSAYAWSPSIAVVRDACTLPDQLEPIMTDGENEVEVMAPFESLPFDVCLYGQLAETLWVGDNGYVAIGGGPPNALQSDVGVPHSLGEPGVPGPGVVPFWDSMQPSSGGVCAAVDGAEPNRTLWLTWSGACFEEAGGSCAEAGSSLTFSVGFEESTGSVLVGYVSMSGDGALAERAMGQTATTGITDEGARGCTADQCNDAGSCEDGSPCGYTEVASSEIRRLETVVFEPIVGR